LSRRLGWRSCRGRSPRRCRCRCERRCGGGCGCCGGCRRGRGCGGVWRGTRRRDGRRRGVGRRGGWRGRVGWSRGRRRRACRRRRNCGCERRRRGCGGRRRLGGRGRGATTTHEAADSRRGVHQRGCAAVAAVVSRGCAVGFVKVIRRHQPAVAGGAAGAQAAGVVCLYGAGALRHAVEAGFVDHAAEERRACRAGPDLDRRRRVDQ